MEDLGITVAISADDADFDKKVSAVNKEITALKKSANRLKNDLKLDPSNLELMRKRAGELTKALEKAKVVQKAWNDMQAKQLAEGASDEKLKKTTDQLDKAHARVVSLQTALDKVNAEIEYATDKTRQFQDAMSKVSDVAGDVADALKPVSQVAQSFLKRAVNDALDFESAFADVEKTVKSTGDEFMDNFMFSELEKSAKELSTYLPKTASEIAVLMGLAGQMNVPANQIREFTESMIKFGDSTNITAEEAVTDIAQIYNVIGKGGDFSDLNNLLSAIVELGNNSATTEKDITTMFKNISAGASRVKMTESQMVALSATLSSLGLDKGGASAISNIMTKIDKAVTANGADLQEWAKVAGMSADSFKEAWGQDSADTLLQIVTSMSKMTDEGISMNKILGDLDIKELRQIDTLSRLVNAHDEYAKNIELANSAYGEGTALTTEAEKRYATLNSQIQIAKNNFELFAITLGETLMPYIQQLIDGLMQIADWLNNLDPKTKDMIVKIVGLVAVLAPLFMIISKISGGIVAIIDVISFLKGLLSGLFGIITHFCSGTLANIIIWATNHPLLIAITALIAVIVILWNKSEGFRETVKMLWKGLKELWQQFKTDFIQLLIKGFMRLTEEISAVIGFVSNLVSWFGKLIGKVVEFANSIGLISGVGGIISGISGKLGGGANVINSNGFGALNSGGFNSGGITLNANFSVNSNNITRSDVHSWAEWMADDINDILGRKIR